MTARFTGARAALAVFIAGEALAVPLLIARGRQTWFFNDDWDFLANRTAGNVGDLFRSHYDHWTTLPILTYRLLWTFVGLRSYVPYLLVLIALHLAVGALARVVMRRAAVDPWISTIAALLLVWFGSGAENVLVAFQITFVGSLVFGFAHLLLADHDGPFDGRDALGLLAGLAGLMCSGVAVTMLFVVGLAVLLRRGWRLALVHTVPFAVLYAAWRAFSPRGQSANVFHANSPGTVVRFVFIGVSATFGDLARVPAFGLALAALLVVGLALFARSHPAALRRNAAAPIALLAGALMFLVITAFFRSAEIGGVFFRATGPEHARQSRYVYVVAALLLPALALAAGAVIARWRPAAVVVVVLLLVGVPGNVGRFSQFSERFEGIRGLKEGILTTPRTPVAPQLPRTLRLAMFGAPDATVGWLLDSVPSGRIPKPSHPGPIQIASVTLSLALQKTAPGPQTRCVPLSRPVRRVLARGETITVAGGTAVVVYEPEAGAQSLPKRLGPGTYVARAGPLPLSLSRPPRAGRTSQICAGSVD